jgi:hypothetical protein
VHSFLFSGYSLRLQKPKQKASSKVKNHRRPLFRVYKGPSEIRSNTLPEPAAKFKLEGETPVPRTTHARATPTPRTACPVALTPRQGKHHLWQAKQASFHLRHDDRVKKVRHTI